jgi:hypothetical protein
MTSNTPTSAISMLSLLLLSATTCAVAQNREPVHLSGLINDYSPLSATVKGSPREMHGHWTLDVHEKSGTADFAALQTARIRKTDGIYRPRRRSRSHRPQRRGH